jgi:hypothetical protein
MPDDTLGPREPSKEEMQDLVTRPLSVETFLRYYKEKTGGGKVCPECGVNDWQPSTRDENTPDVFHGSLPDSNIQQYIPIVILNCGNCGYIKLFHRDPLAKWEFSTHA